MNDRKPPDKPYTAGKPTKAEPPKNYQKYTKIQPAIAPKPVAVLPKPSFTPVVNGGMQVQTSYTDTLKPFTPSFNINTSKRWVLPPRPRPGRKPTSLVEEEAKTKKMTEIKKVSVKAETKRPSPKKRIKVCKEEKDTPLVRSGSEKSLDYNENSIKTEKYESVLAPVTSIHVASSSESSQMRNSESTNRQLSRPPDNSEITELKLSYLSKLKEQELIRNYIDVITSQIKELSFVQNGVITFDALKNTTAKKKVEVNRASSSHEQLELINNLNDLNKFVGYLSTSSNILHSATKKSRTEDEDDGLNNQIDHYLDVRAKFQALKNEELKTTRKQKEPKGVNIGIDKAVTDMKPSSIINPDDDVFKGELLPFELEMDDDLILQVGEDLLLMDDFIESEFNETAQ